MPRNTRFHAVLILFAASLLFATVFWMVGDPDAFSGVFALLGLMLLALIYAVAGIAWFVRAVRRPAEPRGFPVELLPPAARADSEREKR